MGRGNRMNGQPARTRLVAPPLRGSEVFLRRFPSVETLG